MKKMLAEAARRGIMSEKNRSEAILDYASDFDDCESEAAWVTARAEKIAERVWIDKLGRGFDLAELVVK
jgi:hypothetical protein